MSIIIAYKKDDVIYMGTDTRTIINEHKKNELCESNYKIQKMENGMLVGMTAERLTRQTIFAYPEIFTLDKKGVLTRKHIVKEIIPKLKELINENGLMIKKEGRLPYMDASIFLAHKGELYEICTSFAVYKYEHFQILGSVADFGQYALEHAQTDDVNQKIVLALDNIAKNSYLVGAPYLLIDTKSKEYKIIRSESQC